MQRLSYPILCLLILLISLPALGQQTESSFGNLADGPYDRLVIRGAMVLPGHGGPPVGPYDILIEGNRIKEMVPFDPITAERRGETDRLYRL